jgi:Gas vesicle synthesis protein GvpO
MTMLSASDAAELAVRHVIGMTKRDAEGVVGVERSDDGWRVTVEIVETHRIPDSADILATYETEVDSDGELVSYRRVGRYLRGQVERT